MMTNETSNTHDRTDARKELLESTPPNLQDDPLSLYLRCRYSWRECLMDLVFTESQRRKVLLETQRITNLRSSFTKHEQARISSELKKVEAWLLDIVNREHDRRFLRPNNVERINSNCPERGQDKIASVVEKIGILLLKFTEEERGEIPSKLEEIKTLRSHCVNRVQDRIVADLVRIEESLSKITSHGQNENLLERMSRHRKEWLDEAKKECNNRTEKVGALLATESLNDLKEKHQRALQILLAFQGCTPDLTPPHLPEPEKDHNVMISGIKLKRKEGSSSFTEFSLENFCISLFLDGKDGTNPILEACDDKTIRYFHFPANNMRWVEEVIVRYNREMRGEYNYVKAGDYCERSSNFLCRAHWTALQHGSNSDPVHARHMRSHCVQVFSEEAVSTGQGSKADSQKGHPQKKPLPAKFKATRNFVIFMPFLHWETDTRRRMMAEAMTTVTDEYRKQERKDDPYLMKELEERLTDTVDKFRTEYGFRVPTLPADKKKSQQGPAKAPSKTKAFLAKYGSLTALKAVGKVSQSECQQTGHKLANYILDVANVYNSMDIHPDLRLLVEHLHSNPPLHPRRTLDQSYHSKLENTGRRDKDQVVYRGTKVGEKKVVMVDQLWLYILDDRTVLTFFPRRWGRNKPDFSGVHRCIRSRLELLRAGEIFSAYDLALMIMNQCSAVFFDRSKLQDSRPQVLDIFSNSIAAVSEKKSIAFERFWEHLKKLNPRGSPQMDSEAIEVAAKVYLDINPEGVLLKECHDIMDELRMMKHVYHQQRDAADHFQKILVRVSKGKSRLPMQGSEKVALQGKIIANGNNTAKNHQPQAQTSITASTKERALNLVADIEYRFNELKGLEANTYEITEHLKALLDLKQQQAGIIEAKLALCRADESVKQGRAIMMFTVITIIFLPLSFMSSIFGMNAQELSSSNGGVMSIYRQFKYMFPISFGIIFVSLMLAFSTWIRGAILFCASVVWAWSVEYSRLRAAWRWSIRGYNAKRLYEQDRKVTEKIFGRRQRRELRNAQATAVRRENERCNEDPRAGRYRDVGAAV